MNRGRDASFRQDRFFRRQVATSLRAAGKAGRGQEHAALVIDQLFMEADGEAADVVLENTGDAVPVFVSFAISRAERVVCDVRLSLRRREKERLLAHREAESAMRSQLTEALTGILLS